MKTDEAKQLKKELQTNAIVLTLARWIKYLGYLLVLGIIRKTLIRSHGTKPIHVAVAAVICITCFVLARYMNSKGKKKNINIRHRAKLAGIEIS